MISTARLRRHVFGDELGHLVGGDRSARHDECFGDLAGLLVGERNHRRVGDRGVRQQQCFQFGGGDRVALVLDPVDDPKRAVLLDAGDVSGVRQPSGSIVRAVA